MEDYEVIINLLFNILGSNYAIKKVNIHNYGKGVISYGEKDWTHEDGSAIILGKKEDLNEIKDKKEIDAYDVVKLIKRVYKENHTLIVGSNLYYGSVLEEESIDKISIDLFLNKICCYSKNLKVINIFNIINNYLINYGCKNLNKKDKNSKVKKYVK